MAIDLSVLVKLSPEQQRRFDDRVHRDCVRDGDAAYRAGLAIDACPPFVDNDMACFWRIGWHHAHEEDVQRRPGPKSWARCDDDCRHSCGWVAPPHLRSEQLKWKGYP